MPRSIVYSYTGAQQTFVVPTGVAEITFDVQGAQGSTSGGGLGGRAQGVLAVTPGETLYLYVGGQAGWNGGGGGGSGPGAEGVNGFAGGGRSDIRKGGTTFPTHVQVVAGGGGGPSANYPSGYGRGGQGGGATGSEGAYGNPSAAASGAPGNPGTQLQGGNGGQPFSTGTYGENGDVDGVGEGGEGGDGVSDGTGGGGGGGGWHGGGGGGGGTGWAGGGGGGSGYTGGADVSSPSMTSGYRSGDGQITLTYQVTLLVTVDDPTVDAVLVDPPLFVNWHNTNGTGLQNDYRLRIYDALTDVLVYDSGQIASSTTQTTVPSSQLPTGVDYYLTVEVNDSEGGYGISDEVPFSVDWTLPPGITMRRARGVSEEVIDR